MTSEPRIVAGFAMCPACLQVVLLGQILFQSGIEIIPRSKNVLLATDHLAQSPAECGKLFVRP